MILSHIKQFFKKQFPADYLSITSRFNKAEDPETKVRLHIYIYTSVFFFLGLSYDTGSYLLAENYLLANVNITSLSLFLSLAFLFKWKKISIHTALTGLLFTIQANVSFSIVHKCIYIIGTDNFIIYHDLYIGFLVCILAALTLRKRKVYLLCTLPLAALGTGLMICSPISLIHFFPNLCLAYVSPPIFLTYIRTYLWKSLREKERLLQEKQAVCKLMGMNKRQWDLLIDAVQVPRVPKEQAQELFDTLQNAISDQLVVKAKQLLVSEELVGLVNKKKELHLTAKEVQLCGLIVEGKSIAEISAIQHIKRSSVRAYRTRLRTKMKLTPGEDLEAHLMQLITEKVNEDYFFPEKTSELKK